MDQTDLSRTERRRLAREAERAGGGGSDWRRPILIWGGLIVVLALIVWGLVVAANRAPTAPNVAKTLATPVSSADWVRGVPLNASSTKPVATLVEYSDFQCSACGRWAPVVKDLLTEFPGQVRIIYRHLPLKTLHPNAVRAAEAAEAAGAQGRFWEMADKLFGEQAEWSVAAKPDDLFKRYAGELKLDLGRFTRDLDSPLIKTKVDDQAAEAARLGLSGTPSFFLNGRELNKLETYADLAGALRDALINNAQP